MDQLSKSTLTRRSNVIRLCLQWNREKLNEAKYVIDSETIRFFEKEVGKSCKQACDKFITLMSHPLTGITDLYDCHDLTFLILALTFYECEALLDDLCYLLIKRKRGWNYVGTLPGLNESSYKPYVSDFLRRLYTTREESVRQQRDICEQLNALKFSELPTGPISFRTIYI